MNNQKIVNELSKIRPDSTFLSVKGYTNSNGEIADYNIVFHISYESLLKRSITILESYIPQDDIELEAKSSLLDGYGKSLKKLSENSQEELEDHYQHFTDDNGRYVKGVKLHKESGTLHLYGVVLNKKVYQAGTYKEVKSKPLTLAKNKLTKDLPISKWRQFKIDPKQVDSIIVEKIQLKP